MFDISIYIVNKYDNSLDLLYKCKFVFWQKEKKRIGECTGKLTLPWYDNFGKKGLCIGMALLHSKKKERKRKREKESKKENANSRLIGKRSTRT